MPKITFSQNVHFLYNINGKVDTTYSIEGSLFPNELLFQKFLRKDTKHILNEMYSKYQLDKAFTNELQFSLSTDLTNFHRTYIDNEGVEQRKKIVVSETNELAIYAFSAHTSSGDMFILKPDNSKKDFFWNKYKAYPFLGDYWFQLNSVDSTTFGESYKIYYYCVSCSNNSYSCLNKKGDKQDYLEIGYCPKLGAIYSYRYIYLDIEVTLNSIDGVLVQDFIHQNRCISPFCEIE